MCLTIPGKIIRIDKGKYIVDYGKCVLEANFSAVGDLNIGDYVIISNRIIVSKVDKEKALKFLEANNGS